MRQEIQDEWRQSQEDLITARVLRDSGRYYASVFFCHQAAEKALKALYMETLGRLPATHNLIVLARDLQAPPNIITAARELNPDYLTTRYVDAANGVPADMYDAASAERHLQFAEEVGQWVASLLPTS